MSTEAVISIKDLSFRWKKPKTEQPSWNLEIPNLELNTGQHLFILGTSGSGKTTLLNLMSGMLEPSQGQITVCGQRLSSLKPSQRDRFRAQHLGLIFQQLNLIPYLTPFENVCLPARFAGQSIAELTPRIEQLFNALELPPAVWQQNARALSVGQQQRVAIARALVLKPELIIADEPTSALDADNRDRFMELLLNEAAASGATLVFVSHDQALRKHFQVQLDMKALAQGVQPCS